MRRNRRDGAVKGSVGNQTRCIDTCIVYMDQQKAVGPLSVRDPSPNEQQIRPRARAVSLSHGLESARKIKEGKGPTGKHFRG